MDSPTNLFQNIADSLDVESVCEILKRESVRIERIVSRGQISPPGFWYDQNEDEWIMVLSGRAIIRVEERQETITLEPGDAFHLPAHVRHRVEWTDPLQPTIWLAFYWKSS